MSNVTKSMRDLVREIRRLSNALTYDSDFVFEDVEGNDLWCLGESIHDMKITLQRLMDKATELEYQLYLIRRDDTR